MGDRNNKKEEGIKVPIISLSGSPFELGFQHGSQAKKAIEDNVRFYMNLWQYLGGGRRDEILKDIQGFVPYIEQCDPQILEELQGVADGSGVKVEEIVALNARTEVTFACLPNPMKGAAPGGCTSFAITPEATQNGHMFIGQNWDWRAEAENSCIVLKLHQQDKPDIIMHTEAGTVGHRGFNSAGIGVCINYIRCEDDEFRLGLPFLIKLRVILNSTNLPDCLKMLMSFVGPNSMNMVIAHRDGEAIDVENTPNDVLFLYPEGGILTHANHFESPRLKARDIGKSTLPDTIFRSNRALRLLNDCKGTLGWDTIEEVLKDHFGYPNSICRHRDERDNPIDQWETLSSMIMDLTEGKMLYTEGPPCCHPYKSIYMDNFS